MSDLSSRTRAWKEADDRTAPWITLYEIQISDIVSWRFANKDPLGVGKVTYDGEDYPACEVREEEVEVSIGKDLPSYRLSISNVDGTSGGLIETYDFEGCPLIIRSFASPGGVGDAGTLSPAAADVRTDRWRISSVGYSGTDASVTYGPPAALQRRGGRRFVRRCGHAWQKRHVLENACGYPGDEFEADTAQDFIAGATTNDATERACGWWTLNALTVADEGGVWDVDQTSPGELYCETRGASCDWDAEAQNGPFLFKLLEGDFDVSAETLAYRGREGTSAGILCQSTTDTTSWALVARSLGDSDEWISRLDGALAGAAQSVTYGADASYLRLVRDGDDLSGYISDDGATWTLLGTLTLALGTEVRVGLLLSASDASQGQIAAGWTAFRVAAGGLDTCERTIEDCRLHGNVHRFGGYPGMPTA